MPFFKILIVKETRAGERRVALLPAEVKQLVQAGHQVFVESDAGKGVDVADEAYEKAGAVIRPTIDSSSTDHQAWGALFQGINLTVRAKRPDGEREPKEIAAMPVGAVLIGALDPFEPGGDHIKQYHAQGVKAYSIDQLNVPTDSPMSILAAMSGIAGKLALQDALEKHERRAKKAVIIGFGLAGQAAFEEALQQGLQVTAFYTRPEQQEFIVQAGGEALFFDKQNSLSSMQQLVKQTILEADIVIAGARAAGQQAPLLIPESTLHALKPNTVVVDLAIAEGGNVAGSQHDQTVVTDNQVKIVNVSGYPKAVPLAASQKWSQVSLSIINELAKDHQASSVMQTARV